MTFKAAGVRFIQEHALPSVDHNVRDQILSDVDWDEDEFEAFAALHFDLLMLRRLMHRPISGHKMLGYADLIQPTFMEPGTRLLCQINSDDHCDMMWADGGTIYFNILHADLEANDFSRIYSELQSG